MKGTGPVRGQGHRSGTSHRDVAAEQEAISGRKYSISIHRKQSLEAKPSLGHWSRVFAATEQIDFQRDFLMTFFVEVER